MLRPFAPYSPPQVAWDPRHKPEDDEGRYTFLSCRSLPFPTFQRFLDPRLRGDDKKETRMTTEKFPIPFQAIPLCLSRTLERSEYPASPVSFPRRRESIYNSEKLLQVPHTVASKPSTVPVTHSYQHHFPLSFLPLHQAKRGYSLKKSVKRLIFFNN